MSQPHPLIIAHRGAAALWPENSLGAFEKAIEMGVDGIELDIQCLKDGTLIVYHDDRLRPAHAQKDGVWLSAPTPRLVELRYDDLRGIDIGTDRGRLHEPDFTPIENSAIPRFTEVLDLIDRKASADFLIYAELKTNMIAENEALELAARFCETLLNWKSISDFEKQIVVVSFDWRCLDYVRAQFPNIRHGYTTLPFADTDPSGSVKKTEADSPTDQKEDAPKEVLRALSARGAPWWNGHDWRLSACADHAEAVLKAMSQAKAHGWCAYGRDVDAHYARHAHDLGLNIHAWTINDRQNAERLSALGVASLITDRPDLLIRSGDLTG